MGYPVSREGQERTQTQALRGPLFMSQRDQAGERQTQNHDCKGSLSEGPGDHTEGPCEVGNEIPA